mmetsp:Transcript_23368/g.57997  ORF Transcript_23368/g.57997 Transcript_23368/m.57997 type:complete len:125 (-) Transcript_23368:79-453(-)
MSPSAAGLARPSLTMVNWDIPGYIGGGILAVCVVPQIIKVFRTRSAKDISFLWSAMYILGLVLTTVYLIGIGATAGYVGTLIEIAVAVFLVLTKIYFDSREPAVDANLNSSTKLDVLAEEEDPN